MSNPVDKRMLLVSLFRIVLVLEFIVALLVELLEAQGVNASTSFYRVRAQRQINVLAKEIDSEANRLGIKIEVEG